MVPKHLMAICSLAVGRTDHLSELASAVGVDSRLAKAVCVLSRAPTSDILRLTDLRDILTTLGVLEVDKVLSLVAIARRSLQHASRSIDTLQLGVSPHVLQSLMVAAMPLRLRHTWLQRAAGVYHGAGGGRSGVGHDRVAVQRVVTSVVAPLVASVGLPAAEGGRLFHALWGSPFVLTQVPYLAESQRATDYAALAILGAANCRSESQIDFGVKTITSQLGVRRSTLHAMVEGAKLLRYVTRTPATPVFPALADSPYPSRALCQIRLSAWSAHAANSAAGADHRR